MRRAGQAAAVGLVLAMGAFGLSGCGSRRDGARGGPPTVVASTDVWGSVAQSVAGADARVSSIVTSGSADPQSYEASPSDAAAIADACDARLRIPIRPQVRSMNLAISTALAVGEAMRQTASLPG